MTGWTRYSYYLYDLVHWAKAADTHTLIKSCVLHYEFEFIHPFADGNGRMGRMWQTLLLAHWKPLFAWLPVESLIRERQQEYYDILAVADKAADSTVFVEFMLRVIRGALSEFLQTEQVREQVTAQVKRLLTVLGGETLSAKELLERLGLKHRQSFSSYYLRPALELGLIEMTAPDKPNSSKQQYVHRFYFILKFAARHGQQFINDSISPLICNVAFIMNSSPSTNFHDKFGLSQPVFVY